MSAPDAVLLEHVRTALASRGASVDAMQVASVLRDDGKVVGDETLLALVDALDRESAGAGPLEALLREPDVTDVLVNGHEQVFVDRGNGLERTAVNFADDTAVRRLAQRLAASGGRRLDDASPFVDVRLRDGTRLHAALAPLARPGTLLSLRVPARRVFSLEELVDRQLMSASGARVLADLMASRTAFLVTGGTGSGKTTLLAALLSMVPARERILLVEDSAELHPDHPHVVALEARPANVEGAGTITLRDLVRHALRMRPDRLVLGEARGAEVVDLLAALNTGHEGGCSTVHANSVADVPARLEALASTAGLDRQAVHAQVLAGLRVIVHLHRGRDGRRRLAQVGVLSAVDGGLGCLPALEVSADGRLVSGSAVGELERLLYGSTG
ncbi:MAG: TadA family conjugal transfer-associated ATPase [Nocardioidaceae bacterium]|nr:TadA family conjugal transfer-associated ATPase [Nocardioidaceae bacterium]